MSEIQKKIRTGVFYTALSKYSNTLISILISIVLARLLTPREYGVVAMISVFIVFFNTLGNIGIGPAIVQNKSLMDKDISSIFSFSILVGLVLALCFFFISPFLARFYNEPLLINLSKLMSLSILFHSLQVVPNALILKKLRFKLIGIVSVSVNIICGIISIILAFMDFSYYALVLNSILTGFFLFAIYFYLNPIKPSLFIRMESVKKILHFSLFQSLFQIINYFATNLDNLLIGKYFNSSTLGLYDRAYKLMRLPVQNLSNVLTPVLHPVLSEHQNDKNVLYKSNFSITSMLAIIGFPLSIYLYFSASEIITLLYGSNWLESIPLFKILALSVGVNLIVVTTGSFFQSTNRTDLLFYSGLIGSLLAVIGFSYGTFIAKSLLSICYGLLVARTLNFFSCYYLLINRAMNHSFLKFIKILRDPLLLSIFLVIVFIIFSLFNISNLWLSFILKTFIFLSVFGIFIIYSKESFDLFKKYLKLEKNN